MHRIVNDEALDALFRAACNPNAWLERPVSDTLLRAVAELVRLGPTSNAGLPARLVFVKSTPAKTRLAAAAPQAAGAIGRAAVTAIIAHRREPEAREAISREAMLRAAYLILAARSLGLDCRPIWEFDAAGVDAMFFPQGGLRSDFLCLLGYGDGEDAVRPVSDECNEGCEIL